MSKNDNREGASSIEYGLIAALIAVIIIASVTALGPIVVDLFKKIF